MYSPLAVHRQKLIAVTNQPSQLFLSLGKFHFNFTFEGFDLLGAVGGVRRSGALDIKLYNLLYKKLLFHSKILHLLTGKFCKPVTFHIVSRA